MSVSTANDSFDQDECSYGYDYTHIQNDDADVALAADRPPATPSATANSANHNGRGQNIVYVEWPCRIYYLSTLLAGLLQMVLREIIFT